jgi:hypothetical protein
MRMKFSRTRGRENEVFPNKGKNMKNVQTRIVRMKFSRTRGRTWRKYKAVYKIDDKLMIDPIGGGMGVVGAAAAGDGPMTLAKALCYDWIGWINRWVNCKHNSKLHLPSSVTVLITNSGQSRITSDVLGAQSRAVFWSNRQIMGDGVGVLEKHFQQKEIKTFSQLWAPIQGHFENSDWSTSLESMWENQQSNSPPGRRIHHVDWSKCIIEEMHSGNPWEG